VSATTTAEASEHRHELAPVYDSPAGVRGWLSAVSHKPIGRRFIVTSIVFFLVGGVEALAIRMQLVRPESTLIGPQAYNELFTMHGSTMMFFFAVPFLEGMANYLVPLQIGSRDLPFPRLNAFNYWLYLSGGALLYVSVLAGAVPDGGWFAYVPLTDSAFSPGKAMDFWLTGVTLAEISAIGAAVEFIASILRTRARGMSLARMPLFVWSILIASFMIVVGFTPLAIGSLLLEADRAIGTAFYFPDLGGSPVLWQHFFWIFGHPEVYVMFLPASGIVSQVVQAMTGRPIVGYVYVVSAIVAVGFLSMGLWVHHMFTVGIPDLSIALFSAASLTIAIPNGIQIFAWLGTIWEGRSRRRVPLLFVIGFIVIFVLGGITGVMVAVAPFDWQAHDSHFIVAHFHYVLVGGVVFPALAGIYYWFPKLTGRMLDERWGVASFWTTFIGFNVAFFPMHLTGLMGMVRRAYTYDEQSGFFTTNLISTIGAFVLAVGFLMSVGNAAWCVRRGRVAEADPWHADTLEWSVASPPPPQNFADPPVVTSRHPLWSAQSGPTRGEVGQVDLNGVPRTWRSTPGTTPVRADLTEVVHLPSPTLVPLVPAAGLVIVAGGLLAGATWSMVAGAALTVLGLIRWAVGSERERRAALEREPVPAGLPLDGDDGRGVGWTGTVLTLGIGAVALSSLVFAYYYLRFHNDDWPPLRVIGGPPPAWPLVAGAALSVLAALVVGAGARRTERISAVPTLPSASGAVLAAAGALVTAAGWTLAEVSLDQDAYTSAYASLVAAAVLVLGLSALCTATSWWMGRGAPPPGRARALLRRCTAVQSFAALTSLVVLAVLQLAPMWTEAR
jgi:cytochrome c oxidase subunit I+III